MLPTLQSQRLILRPFAQTDADDLYLYASDPEVGPRAGWKPHESLEESRAILRSFIENDDVFAVTEKASGRVIGSLGLHQDRTRQNPFSRMVGYVLSRDCWGRGYMPEAVRIALLYAFGQLGCTIVSVSHFSFNDRSRRVIEKCGFLREGVIRDAFVRFDGATFDEYIYSMTKTEWDALCQ